MKISGAVFCKSQRDTMSYSSKQSVLYINHQKVEINESVKVTGCSIMRPAVLTRSASGVYPFLPAARTFWGNVRADNIETPILAHAQSKAMRTCLLRALKHQPALQRVSSTFSITVVPAAAGVMRGQIVLAAVAQWVDE
ncbi:hypothetical protein OUZ56_004463 [Daphnia magna]|uniref:Uncharacterized protein n=1 Tax=Daphnia magna TaxID=35525 RepID=A0ABQ9YQ31_9CRUS|nr:hypothetical protein OUZ56_004463 [Daphnia magna]